MITEELVGKNTKEIEDLLQSKLNEYTEKLNATTDVEELKALELDIDKQQEELDDYIRKATYNLRKDPVEFEGKSYKPGDIAKKISYYLNKNEQTFEYCLGLHQLVAFWKTAALDVIEYGYYDSTLRLLGQLKYKGDSEWVDILVINEYLHDAHDAYIRDRAALIYLAELRSRTVSRIQLCTPAAAADAE